MIMPARRAWRLLTRTFKTSQVWADVAAARPGREAALASFESDLAAAESDRAAAVAAALGKLGAELEEAAHVDPGAAQRLIEAEALELDDALLEDR